MMTESIQNHFSKRDVIVLSASFPFGKGETFLENELPFLLERFPRVFLLPMFPEGSMRAIDKRIKLLHSTPPSTVKVMEFMRGIADNSGMFFSEWKNSPGYPASAYLLYLTARTLGIARRIEYRLLHSAKAYSLKNALIYCYWMNQSSIGGIMAAKQLGWPVVSRAHGGDLYTERYPFNYLPWHHWKVQNLDYVLPVSEYGKKYLINKYPDTAVRVLVQRLGVSEKGKINHIPGISQSIHIASCSSIIPLKKVDYILQTVASLGEMLPDHNIRWTHIGSGPLHKEIQKKAALIKNSNLQIYLPGQMKNDAIVPYYIDNKVDLFINYSTSEGIPVTIMEAFSCGIPAIAPKVGGIPEIVNERNGILFEPNDLPENVAAQIYSCIQSGNLPGKSKIAFNHWKQMYDHQKNYQKFMNFLTRL